MRAALMELHSPSQNHLIWGMVEEENFGDVQNGDYSKAGKVIFGQSGSFNDEYDFHLLLAGAVSV